MLRITVAKEDTGTTLVVEGRIVAPWIPELRAAVVALAPQRARRLDLDRVSFIDAEGAALLVELERDGVVLVARSPFLVKLCASYADLQR